MPRGRFNLRRPAVCWQAIRSGGRTSRNTKARSERAFAERFEGARNDYLIWRIRRDSNPRPPFGGQCGTEILVGDKRSKMPLSAVLQGFRILLCLAV